MLELYTLDHRKFELLNRELRAMMAIEGENTSSEQRCSVYVGNFDVMLMLVFLLFFFFQTKYYMRRHMGKTNNLHRRKQRRRSASQ